MKETKKEEEKKSKGKEKLHKGTWASNKMN